MTGIDAATITIETRKSVLFRPIKWAILSLRLFGYVPAADSRLGTLLRWTLLMRLPGGQWRHATDPRVLR